MIMGATKKGNCSRLSLKVKGIPKIGTYTHNYPHIMKYLRHNIDNKIRYTVHYILGCHKRKVPPLRGQRETSGPGSTCVMAS